MHLYKLDENNNVVYQGLVDKVIDEMRENLIISRLVRPGETITTPSQLDPIVIWQTRRRKDPEKLMVSTVFMKISSVPPYDNKCPAIDLFETIVFNENFEALEQERSHDYEHAISMHKAYCMDTFVGLASYRISLLGSVEDSVIMDNIYLENRGKHVNNMEWPVYKDFKYNQGRRITLNEQKYSSIVFAKKRSIKIGK